MNAQSQPYASAAGSASARPDVTDTTTQDVRSTLKETAEKAVETGSEMAGQAQDAAVDAYTSMKRFANEQPVLAIAAVAVTAIAAGAVIARLSRPSRTQTLLGQLNDVLEPYARTLRR